MMCGSRAHNHNKESIGHVIIVAMPIYRRAREENMNMFDEGKDVGSELVSETEKYGGDSNSKEVDCEYHFAPEYIELLT